MIETEYVIDVKGIYKTPSMLSNEVEFIFLLVENIYNHERFCVNFKLLEFLKKVCFGFITAYI